MNPTRNCLLFQTSFPRQQNGTCTNGVLKNFSVNSDENERGVTFRVGKFIGQVTIESKIEIKILHRNTKTYQVRLIKQLTLRPRSKTQIHTFLFFLLIFHYSFYKQIQGKILNFQRLNFTKKCSKLSKPFSWFSSFSLMWTASGQSHVCIK